MPPATLATPADPFALLNDEQRAAVEHGPAGPLLVIAGAGTGKTMTLAARVARLVLDGADPNRLLLLTFSRRAAHEMERRAGRLLHAALGFRATQQAPALPWSGTFHAIGARLLREHAGAVGLSPQFTIHDRGDAEDQVQRVVSRRRATVSRVAVAGVSQGGQVQRGDVRAGEVLGEVRRAQDQLTVNALHALSSPLLRAPVRGAGRRLWPAADSTALPWAPWLRRRQGTGTRSTGPGPPTR